MHRYEIVYLPRSSSREDECHSIQVTLSSLEVAIAHAFTRFIGEVPQRIIVVDTGREVWNRAQGSPYWIDWGSKGRDPYSRNFCSDDDVRLWVDRTSGVNKITHLERDGRVVWEKEAELVREIPNEPIGRSENFEPGEIREIVARALRDYDARECTCHPDDDPPRPCPKRFALSECREAAARGE